MMMRYGCLFLPFLFVLQASAQLAVTGNSLICAGDSAVLTASGSAAYAWTAGNDPGTVFSTASSVLVSPEATTTYTVQGDVSAIAYTVVVQPLPVFLFSDSLQLCPGQVLFSETNYPEAIYAWSTGSQEETTPVPATAVYTLGITLNGCSYTDSVYVELLEAGCNGGPVLPNVFTPNGDGANDVFAPVIGMQTGELRIFNRWGNLVYRGKLPQGWDGTSGGRSCSEGVYFWAVEDGDTSPHRGEVTLIR